MSDPYDPQQDLAWLRSIADAQYPPPSPGVAVQQLAAVLAHDAAHVLHGDSTLERNWGRRAVPPIERERQADAEAARILSRISPEACMALPRVLERLRATNGDGYGATHPSYPDRIEVTTRICEEQAAQGGAS